MIKRDPIYGRKQIIHFAITIAPLCIVNMHKGRSEVGSESVFSSNIFVTTNGFDVRELPPIVSMIFKVSVLLTWRRQFQYFVLTRWRRNSVCWTTKVALLSLGVHTAL